MATTIAGYRELFANVHRRPLMYLPDAGFAASTSFVVGCDSATAGALLTGFTPWLATLAGCGDNLVWWALVLQLTPPAGPKHPRQLDPEVDARAVVTLFDLLDEFLELRDEPDGLGRIFAAYEQWRQLRSADGCLATDAPACPVVDWPRPASRRPPTGTS